MYIKNKNKIFIYVKGERGQVVKAMGCGSVSRGFDPRRSPLEKYYVNNRILVNLS